MTDGLGKTELQSTVRDLVRTPFSLELDGGLKGGKDRLFNVLKCVEKFILAKTIDTETAAVVAECFLDWSKNNKIDIATNLIIINSDHASTLRGSKNGAVKKISEHAPNVT